MQVGAIVAAAGPGTRMGRRTKALVPLHGRTALCRVLEVLLSLDEIDRVVVAAPLAGLEPVRREVAALKPWKPVEVCAGGETRQQSVRAGLAALGDCDYVLVHDAARPMATAALFRRVLAAAESAGAAIPGLPPRDAVKRVEGEPTNIKLTTADDLEMLEALLEERESAHEKPRSHEDHEVARS